MTGTVLVTGASSGIGKAIAAEMVQCGYDVVVVSDGADSLTRAAEDMRLQAKGRAMPIVKDLADPRAAQELYEELDAQGLRIDILVNNAGVGQYGRFHETGLAGDIETIRLNIEALTRLTKLYAKDMAARGSGKILNVGSVAGFHPSPLFAVYGATKAYVNMFSEAIAEELQGTGVTVTVLCPGPVRTRFFERAHAERIRVLDTALVMEPERVAREVVEALLRGKRMSVPGLNAKILAWSRYLLPAAWRGAISKKLYEPRA